MFDAELNSAGGGGLVGVRLMVLDEEFDEAAAILAPTASPDQVRDRPQVEARLVGHPVQFLARHAILALRHRPGQGRAIARPAEGEQLAVADGMHRLAHRFDVGRTHAARDRHMAIIDPGGLGRGLDIVASGWPTSSKSGRLLTISVTPSSFSAGTSSGGSALTSVFSSSCRCIVRLHRPASAASSDSPWRSSFVSPIPSIAESSISEAGCAPRPRAGSRSWKMT